MNTIEINIKTLSDGELIAESDTKAELKTDAEELLATVILYSDTSGNVNQVCQLSGVTDESLLPLLEYRVAVALFNVVAQSAGETVFPKAVQDLIMDKFQQRWEALQRDVLHEAIANGEVQL